LRCAERTTRLADSFDEFVSKDTKALDGRGRVCVACKQWCVPCASLRTEKINEENMKILVAGSSGLVGTALVKALGRDGHMVCRLMRPGRVRPNQRSEGRI